MLAVTFAGRAATIGLIVVLFALSWPTARVCLRGTGSPASWRFRAASDRTTASRSGACLTLAILEIIGAALVMLGLLLATIGVYGPLRVRGALHPPHLAGLVTGPAVIVSCWPLWPLGAPRSAP